jgi:hypothetical protein
MFGEPVFFASRHVRSGTAQLFSEFVAAFGLLSVIRVLPVSGLRQCLLRSELTSRQPIGLRLPRPSPIPRSR